MVNKATNKKLKAIIKKRNSTRKLNQLIDKFNLEKDENKRQDLLEKMGAIPIAETRNPNPKRIGLKRDKNRK
jgi:hypothetical protein